MKNNSYKRQVTYLLKTVVNFPEKLNSAKCENYLDRIKQLMGLTGQK
jgi:hypothetical protein